MDNIRRFDSMDEWLNACSSHGYGVLISPGGAAHLVSVTRECVHNWVYRDKKVTAFIYESKHDGKYILINKNDVIRARLGTRKQRELNITLADILENQLIKK